MKRDKEIIYKLEMESSQLSSDLVAARNDLRQREEDIESLHQIQRDLHRDWDVDRERHRHKQVIFN